MDSGLAGAVDKRGDGNGRGREAIDGWRLHLHVRRPPPAEPKAETHEGALRSVTLAFGNDPGENHDAE